MTQFNYFVGADIASASFLACVGAAPWNLVVKPVKFDNLEDGFGTFLDWLKEHKLTPENTVMCMEATGVFGEGLVHWGINIYEVMHSTPCLDTSI